MAHEGLSWDLLDFESVENYLVKNYECNGQLVSLVS